MRVEPLPQWLELRRLLGDFAWQVAPLPDGKLSAEARLPRAEAALLVARLRGLGIDGSPLVVQVAPGLSRSEVREGRLLEARARRDTTPGFARSGAQVSGEGRFSLTPEALALAMGRAAEGRSVVDAGCGSGGNAIGFARAGSSVIAIDLEPERLAEAHHNAKLYGVEGRIRFLEGDALRLVPGLSADILFADPPWGEDYDKQRTELRSLPWLERLLALPMSQFGELWLKLPASFASSQLPDARVQAWFGEAAGDRQRIKFIQLSRRTKDAVTCGP